jgi:hypothetical protein
LGFFNLSPRNQETMPAKWTSLFSSILVLTFCSFLSASPQKQGEPAKAQDSKLPSTTTLPKNYPVITAKGPCPNSAAHAKSAAASECKVTVSREEFEALVNGMNPQMVKGERRVLADAYGKALALSLEATRRGLDRDPRLQAQLRYSRLIMLANAMSKEIYKDALNGRAQDAEHYYSLHKSQFERFNFERLYIPLEKRASSPSQSTIVETASEKPEDLKKDEMKQLADQMYARALAGEDFGKLQKEVFQTAGIASDANIKVEDLRRGDLSDVQNVIFDLKPNQISSVLTDQTGYFIYKLVSRTVPPFETVKPQVTVRMQNDKSAQGIRSIEKAAQAEVNSAYFDKYDPPEPSKEDADMDSD